MTTYNITNPIPCGDRFIKSGPDLDRDPSYILSVSCDKGEDDCRSHGKRTLSISKASKYERIAFSLLKKRFYVSLIPLLIGFACWILQGFLLSPFNSSHLIITMKDTIFSAYRNYVHFLLMMGAISIALKLSKRIKTVLLKSSKHGNLSVLEFSKEDDIETCSPNNVKAQTTSKKIGWFLLHYSLIFCLYYLIGSCTPSLSFQIQPSSNLLFSVPSTSELLKLSKMNQKPLQDVPHDHTIQNPILSSGDENIELPMSRILGKLNLPHADSLIVWEEGKIAFVSVSRPAGMVKIVSVSDPENPQVLRSIPLNMSEFPSKSLALSPDSQTLIVSNINSTQIISVTDILNPKLLKSIGCPEKLCSRLPHLANATFRVSIAFSEDGNAVFIAGMGLLGYDISNRTAPKEILFDLDTFEEEQPLMSAVLVQDKTLYVANGPLKRYDISDLSHIQSLPPFATKTQVNSLVIHQQNETTKMLFVIGRSDQGVILEEFNISNSASLNDTNSFKLDMDGSQTPFLLAVTESGENLFITSNSSELHIFNFAQRKCIYRNFENLIKPISSLTISQDGHQVYVIANQLLIIYKLYQDYPNQRIFSQTNNTIGNYLTEYPANFMSLISKDQILVLATSKCRVKSVDHSDSCQGNEAAIELLNVSNPASPSNHQTYPLPAALKGFMVFPEQSKAYVTLENGIQILNLSNYSLSLISDFQVEKGTIIRNSVFTPNGKLGFLYETVSDRFKLEIYDFLSFEKITKLAEVSLTPDPSSFDILLSNDAKTIFIIGTNTTRIDVSDPQKPRQVNSALIATDGEGFGYTGFLAQNSADRSENLFIKVRDSNENSSSLQFYNVSQVDVSVVSPYILPDFPLLRSNDTFYTSIVPAPQHSDLIYLASDNGKGESLLVINISNAAKPVLQGTVAVLEESSGDIVSMVISSDGSTAYISTQTFGLQIIQLEVPHTLFLESEIFKLGPKVSTKALMLSLNSEKEEYVIMNQENFKILEGSLFDLKIPSYSESVKISYFQLPYWMAFDKEGKGFVLHPQQEKDIGVYGLHSVYSTKVSLSELNKSSLIVNDDTLLQELIECLINYGYLDNQYFLTSEFDEFEDSPFCKKFEDAKKEIHKILKKSYFETFTMFEILSSLEVNFDEQISIETPSDNDLTVYISLEVQSPNASAQFLNKQYALLNPVINNSEFTLVGPLQRINNALKELVIDLENTENCNGIITIDDHLNPVFTKEISNIATYFKINTPPHLNVSDVQDYINKQPQPFGGQYFRIPLNNLFDDNFSKSLTYTLVEVVEGHEIGPHWFTIEDGIMRGTPPEERSGDTIQFKLTVKNAFKSKDTSFQLTIQKTDLYAAKEVYHTLYLACCIIATFTSWICYKIWENISIVSNICCRSRRRHPKEFYVEVGKEITSNTLFPIFFVKAENEKSQLFLEELGKRIAVKNNRQKPFTNSEISQYFVEEYGEIKKEDLKNEIGEENLSLENASPASQALIIQLIFNELIREQLQLPNGKSRSTKRVFQTLEGECETWVDWEKFPDCLVKEDKLKELEELCQIKEATHTQTSSTEITILDNDGNKPLIDQSEKDERINLELLKCAIVAHALQKQMMNELLRESDILVKGVKEIKNRVKMWFSKRFQLDLFDINFPDINKSIDYGIQFKPRGNDIVFTGTPNELLLNKTIVVQITTRWHKILKEIYIHGIRGPSHMGGEIRGSALESDTKQESSKGSMIL